MKSKDSLQGESSIEKSLMKLQNRNHLKRRQTQPAICLDTLMDDPELLLHRARSGGGMKKSKSTPTTASKLGQLVELNARRGSLFF